MRGRDTGRSVKEIARAVNEKAKKAEKVIAALFDETPPGEKHDLLVGILGVVTEIALNNVLEGEDPEEMLEHLLRLIHTFSHAAELTNKGREERIHFCLGCEKDGSCMSQAIVEDWEDHEAVPEGLKS